MARRRPRARPPPLSSPQVTLAYIVARLKWGDGVDLFFDGAAAKPQSVDGAVAGPTRRLLAAGRRLLQVTVATFIGDTTRTSATFNGFVNEPPDQALCVGRGFLIEATNVVISIRSTSTPATPLANWPKALSRFFGGVSGDSFGDPRCIYDPTSNVFIVAAYRTNGANSWIALASSPASDPAAGTWKTWSIDSRGIGVLAKCTATAPCFGDYPMVRERGGGGRPPRHPSRPLSISERGSSALGLAIGRQGGQKNKNKKSPLHYSAGLQ